MTGKLAAAVADTVAMAHERFFQCWWRFAILVVVLLVARGAAGFVLSPIQIDGATDDWRAVLMSPTNSVIDRDSRIFRGPLHLPLVRVQSTRAQQLAARQ